MSSRRRHQTVADLSTQDGSDEPEGGQDAFDLPVSSSDLSDARIYMLSEAISRSLKNTLKNLKR